MALSAELTLQDYWRILRRRKFLLLSIWGLVVGATHIFTALQTPVYEAQAVVKIEPPPAIAGMMSQNPWDVWAMLNTEVKSIRSSGVAAKAARILGWVSDDVPQEQALRISNALQGQIKSDRVGDSNLLRVTVTSDDAEKAAAIANAVVQAYIEKGIEERSQKIRESKEFTGREMSKAEQKLRESEDVFKRFSEKTGARGVANYLTSQLVTYQARLDDLLKDYTPGHPEVVETRAKITAVQAQIRQLPQEETDYQRLLREVRMNEELYTFLAKKYKEIQISESQREQTAFMDSPAVTPQSPVRPNKRLNMIVGVIVGFFLALMSVLLMENLDTSIGTIEDVEQFLELPVLGVVPHIEVDSLPGKKPLDFLKFPRTSSLEEVRRRLVLFHPMKSSFAEAYHTARTNLRLPIRPGGRPGVVLGFTSAGISEGKTLSATNFALSAAQRGIKTLFLEADLRRPSAHKVLGISREPGLTDYVMGNVSWSQVVRGTPDLLLGNLGVDHVLKWPGIENFHVVTSGPTALNPADILDSSRVDALIQEARRLYDLIILDCAPVMLFADSLLVGSRVDGMVLVYKAGRTARGLLKRAKEQLMNVKTRLSGVLLNDLRAAEMEPQYGYYYYGYKYYSEYTDDDPVKKKREPT